MKNLTLFLLLITGYCINALPADTNRLIPSRAADRLKECDDNDAIAVIIEEAIAVGAPTYNDRNHIGCYRIYEGAAYKILYKYGTKCKKAKNILQTALEKSYGDNTATEKAWIMRAAFDTLLGVPTTTK